MNDLKVKVEGFDIKVDIEQGIDEELRNATIMVENARARFSIAYTRMEQEAATYELAGAELLLKAAVIRSGGEELYNKRSEVIDLVERRREKDVIKRNANFAQELREVSIERNTNSGCSAKG